MNGRVVQMKVKEEIVLSEHMLKVLLLLIFIIYLYYIY